MVTLFSDITMAMSQARQRDAVVRRCAKGPRDLQKAARAAEKSVTNDNHLKQFTQQKWVILLQGVYLISSQHGIRDVNGHRIKKKAQKSTM